jgi:hypothetical protein
LAIPKQWHRQKSSSVSWKPYDNVERWCLIEEITQSADVAAAFNSEYAQDCYKKANLKKVQVRGCWLHTKKSHLRNGNIWLRKSQFSNGVYRQQVQALAHAVK